jgi:hypothetical protein
MSTVMSDRIRLIIDTDDDIRRAVQLRRIKMPRGTSTSDVVNQILRQELAEEIASLQHAPEENDSAPEPPPEPKKPGRRRKES